ncbi:MAG: sigma-70 family RNA polymerase sigma factor [Planctomycetota bacterium]
MPLPHRPTAASPEAERAGTPEAHAERVAAAEPAVRAFAGRLLGRTPFAQEIDDVVQDTLARALRSAHSLDASRPIEPWLRGICVRVAADRARGGRERLADDASAASEPSIEGDADRVDARDELERRLAVLAPLQRELLLAFHREGRSVAELAREHALPEGTVKSHLHRARRALRAIDDREERT